MYTLLAERRPGAAMHRRSQSGVAGRCALTFSGYDSSPHANDLYIDRVCVPVWKLRRVIGLGERSDP